MLAAVDLSFGLMQNAEITLEANPGTLTLDYLRELRATGVNRLSLGVQSFSDAELAQLGRIHTCEEAMESIFWARQAGFENLSLGYHFWLTQAEFEGLGEQLARGYPNPPRSISRSITSSWRKAPH